MVTPRINPVGIVEYPDDYQARPRGFSRPTRLFAGLLLVFFFAATVFTGAISLGAYCLTSDGGDTRALREGVQRWTEAAPTSTDGSPTEDDAPEPD